VRCEEPAIFLPPNSLKGGYKFSRVSNTIKIMTLSG